MKTGFDIVTDVRSLINVPEVTERITGKVWPFARPNNSRKIDIVVGLLTGNNEWLQEAIVNIRIHVPNLTETIDGANWTKPDLFTFNSLSKLILPLVESQWRDTFHTEVDDPGAPFQDDDGSWFYRIRVNYYSMQTDYKNI